MPIGAQPKKARGTVERPYSALNLRLWLAAFGFFTCAFMAGLAFWLGYTPFGLALAVLALLAVVDMVVIQARRRAARAERARERELGRAVDELFPPEDR